MVVDTKTMTPSSNLEYSTLERAEARADRLNLAGDERPPAIDNWALGIGIASTVFWGLSVIAIVVSAIALTSFPKERPGVSKSWWGLGLGLAFLAVAIVQKSAVLNAA